MTKYLNFADFADFGVSYISFSETKTRKIENIYVKKMCFGVFICMQN